MTNVKTIARQHELIKLLQEKPRTAFHVPVHLRSLLLSLEKDGAVRYDAKRNIWSVAK